MAGEAESDSARLVFHDTPRGLTVSEFRVAIDSINNAYEFLAIGTLPGYDSYPISSRVAPRIHSRLAKQDELRVTTLQYGSPFDVLLHGVPWLMGGLGVYLGYGVQQVIKDGGESIANLMNIRGNIRSKRAKNEADIADNQLRKARAEKSLEALRNSDRSGGGGDSADIPGQHTTPVLTAAEEELERVVYTDQLIRREVSKVIGIAGPPHVVPQEAG